METSFCGMALEEIRVGMSSSYSKTITELDVENFAEISGDRNPVHLNESFASSSKFGRRIAHGLMSASFFSALFGTKIPGPGCVYASQNLTFRKPVYIGDTVEATVLVTSIDISKRRVVFDTTCRVSGRKVITGTAEIYVP
jgi:3-hydroxybutyryl-CoA dehydratase